MSNLDGPDDYLIRQQNPRDGQNQDTSGQTTRRLRAVKLFRHQQLIQHRLFSNHRSGVREESLRHHHPHLTASTLRTIFPNYALHVIRQFLHHVSGNRHCDVRLVPVARSIRMQAVARKKTLLHNALSNLVNASI
ncbi:MAG: hypothetical protein WCJ38_04270 [Actinomycetes bacterium]